MNRSPDFILMIQAILSGDCHPVLGVYDRNTFVDTFKTVNFFFQYIR